VSHACSYIGGECQRCSDEAEAEADRELRSRRGRWMVVQDDATAYRYTSKTAARRHVTIARKAGVGARMLRWRRDRVEYVWLWYGVRDARWTP
jgi:hypothetical protein